MYLQSVATNRSKCERNLLVSALSGMALRSPSWCGVPLQPHYGRLCDDGSCPEEDEPVSTYFVSLLEQPFMRTRNGEQTLFYAKYGVEANGTVVGPTAVPIAVGDYVCLLYTSPSPRDGLLSRMPSSA